MNSEVYESHQPWKTPDLLAKENGMRYHCRDNDVVVDFFKEENELHIYIDNGGGTILVMSEVDFMELVADVLSLRGIIGTKTLNAIAEYSRSCMGISPYNNMQAGASQPSP